MADIDSQVSFSVTTESGEVRSMTPEEINAFVRQQPPCAHKIILKSLHEEK
jgi:hypothetical protein